MTGGPELLHQEGLRVPQGDADLPPLEDRRQEVRLDLPDGRRRQGFRQGCQGSGVRPIRWSVAFYKRF